MENGGGWHQGQGSVGAEMRSLPAGTGVPRASDHMVCRAEFDGLVSMSAEEDDR